MRYDLVQAVLGLPSAVVEYRTSISWHMTSRSLGKGHVPMYIHWYAQ